MAVQKISTHGHCWRRELCQLTKAANFKATPMKKHIWQFITCLLVMQARFLFFFLTNKNELSLTCRINFDHWQSVPHSLVFFACVGIKEYPGNFQNETVISKLFFKRSAKVKEGLFEVDKKHRFIL